jgi:hypothetical protein
LPDAEIEELVEQSEGPLAEADSAVEYVQAVLNPQPSLPHRSRLPAPAPPMKPTRERSQWERISLTDDVELHVRRPLSRIDNRRVERLLEAARRLFEEKP